MVRRSEEELEWLEGKGSHRIQSVFCIVSMYFHRIKTTVLITVMIRLQIIKKLLICVIVLIETNEDRRWKWYRTWRTIETKEKVKITISE